MATQRDAITHQACSAIQVAAATRIIDTIAVADIEAALAAVLPDRVLDEPRKGLRERWIELPGIDPLGDGLNNVSAAAGPVAGRTIQVVGIEPGENAGPVQKVVHQRVDGDHAAADLGPEAHLSGSTEQQGGQGHKTMDAGSLDIGFRHIKMARPVLLLSTLRPHHVLGISTFRNLSRQCTPRFLVFREGKNTRHTQNQDCPPGQYPEVAVLLWLLALVPVHTLLVLSPAR
jgi:hypothetical protein